MNRSDPPGDRQAPRAQAHLAQAHRAPSGRPQSLASETALAVVTLAGLWSLTRLFDRSSFVPRLCVVAVIAHLLAAGTRRLQLNAMVRLAVCVGGFAVVLTALYLPSTGLAGLVPTARTLSDARLLLHDGWGRFGSVKAPAPLLTGFVLSAAGAAWVVAWVADWLAFRAWAAVESVIPATALFVFAAMLGTPAGRTSVTVVFLVTVLVFVALHRAGRDRAASAWVAGQNAPGARALVAWGLPVAVVAVLAGAVVGPNLPGEDQPALVRWREAGQQDDPASLASPLVDMKKRLVDQSDRELFTVQADHRAYWRLMSLERFTGQEWRSAGEFSGASGDLPHDNHTDGRRSTNRQTFRLESTGEVWVPAAFEVSKVGSSTAKLRWDPAAGALIVDSATPTADGLVYSVTSAAPTPTAAQLNETGDPLPAGIRERYLSLPSDLDTRVAQTALQVTSGAAGPAAKARALEDWFRGPGGFRYSLAPRGGQSADALAEFLFQSREGYCEQFSGAFAAMARTLGIPSRVAVGYTWGDYDQATRSFHVKGRNAHAWPEVWLAGAGWVPFEPTPGRGLPDATAWSGTRAQQDEGNGTATAPAPSTVPGAGPTTVPDFTPVTPGSAPATVVRPRPAPRPAALGTAPAASRPSGWHQLATLGMVVAGLVVAWLVAVPLLLQSRHRRRRAGATTADAKVGLAWTEATEAVAALGLALDPSETPAELTGRVRWTIGADVATPLHRLAGLTADALWALEGSPEPTAVTAGSWRDEVERSVIARLKRRGRLRRALDPRPLVPGYSSWRKRSRMRWPADPNESRKPPARIDWVS